MNAYTMSRLAFDAGLSVHIVRGYLLRPVACTPGGYGVRRGGLQRLCFVREAFEAGIGLNALARLCRALDTADSDHDSCKTLKGLEPTAIDAEISPLWISLALTAARVEGCGKSCRRPGRRDPGLCIVYKEFPIRRPDSIVAARAALAAHRQGKVCRVP